MAFFRHPKQESRGKAYTDQIPDLTVEILSPSNKGEEWEDECRLYRDKCPEVWFFQPDGNVEIWRVPEPNRCWEPGDLFSSPLFPGLAIDPAWMKNYPEEIARIEQFNLEIIVAPSVINPKLTKKARALADRIAQHFGQASRSAQFESEIRREPGRPPRISHEPRARRQHEPGREHER